MPRVSDGYLQTRRQDIMAGAARCFARDGFHRTSIQDIAAETGISAGLIYRYFTGKDDMIAAIASQWHSDQTYPVTGEDAPDPERDLASTHQRYLQLLRSVSGAGQRDRLRVGVQVWAEALQSGHIRAVARRGVDQHRAALRPMLLSAQQNHRLPGDVDPDSLVRILAAIYQGLALQTLWDDGLDIAAFVDTVDNILIHLSEVSAEAGTPLGSV